MNFSELLDANPAKSLDFAEFAAIDGWMTAEAADLTLHLAALQSARRQVTGVLELGVFKGKYLSLLAALFADRRVPVVGVDAFIVRIGEQVAPKYQKAVKEQIEETVARMTRGMVTPTLLVAFTHQLEAQQLRAYCPPGYSFISVDAGHEAHDVRNDLGLSETLMSEHAIIAADDVFNPQVPGVVEGLCQYFADHPNTDLRPFANCGNKLFLCRKAMHPIYLAYMHWLLDNKKDHSYLVKSASLRQSNRQADFVPKLFGAEIISFEWS